jgi:hypothetical protein
LSESAGTESIAGGAMLSVIAVPERLNATGELSAT